MEQSMVHELENMRSSSESKNNCSSSLDCGSSNLINSEILDFSSSKQLGHSSKLPTVLTCQTIEIGRLNAEIQSLRRALQKYQNQVVNCRNCEAQIRQLNEQCLSHDNQVNEYRCEIQRLQAVSQELCQQLQNQKAKNSSSDPSQQTQLQPQSHQHSGLKEKSKKKQVRFKPVQQDKDSQLSGMRRSIVSSAENATSWGVNERVINERRAQEGYIKMLEDKVSRYESDVGNLLMRSQVLQIKNERNLSNENRAIEAENRITRLTEETVRLSELLSNKQQLIDAKTKNESMLKNKIVEMQRQFDQIRYELTKVPQLQSSARDWAMKCSQIEGHASRFQDSAARASVLEKNLEGAKLEIERLNWVIRSKADDLNQKDKLIQSLSAACEELKREESKTQSLYQLIHDSETQMKRMSEALRQKSQEVEQNKNSSRQLEGQVRAWEEAESRTKQIQDEYHRQIQEQGQYIRRLEEQSKKILDLQMQLGLEQEMKARCISEIDELNCMIEQQKQSSQVHKLQCHELKGEIDALRGLQQTLFGCRDQNGRMSQEIGKLQTMLEEKCGMLYYLGEAVVSLQESVQRCKEAENQLTHSLKERETVMTELESYQTQNEELERRLFAADVKIDESEFKASEIEEDRQILHTTLNQRNGQIEQAQSRIQSLQAEVSQLHEVEGQYHRAQNELNELSQSCQDLSHQLQIEHERLQELHGTSEGLRIEIQEIKRNGYFPKQFRAVFADVKSACQSRQSEIEGLQRRQKQIDKALENICTDLGKGNHEIQGSSWDAIVMKVDHALRLAHRVSDLEEENYNLRLESLQIHSSRNAMSLNAQEAQDTFSNISQNSPLTPSPQFKANNPNKPFPIDKKTPTRNNPSLIEKKDTPISEKKAITHDHPSSLAEKKDTIRDHPPTLAERKTTTRQDPVSAQMKPITRDYAPPDGEGQHNKGRVDFWNSQGKNARAHKPPTPPSTFKGNFTFRC